MSRLHPATPPKPRRQRALAGGPPRPAPGRLTRLLLLLACPALAAQNRGPTALPQQLDTPEDTPVEAQVEASDPDGDALTFSLASKPTHGEARLDPRTGQVRYLPAADFHGDDAFVVQVSDGRRSAKAQLSVRVSPVNDVPVARPQALTTPEDTAAQGRVLAEDADGDALRYRLLRAPEHGTASVDPGSGAVTYQPAPDFHGADSFSVEVSEGAFSDLSDVTVTVTPVNDAPVLAAQRFTLEEDATLEVQLPASDVDGDALGFRLTQKPLHGAASLDARTGALRYVPQADFAGEDSCRVEVSDGKRQATALLTFQVTPVNDGPVLQPLALSTREDTPVSGRLVSRDVDSTLTFRVSTPPPHGEARVDPATGQVHYAPGPDFFGDDAFEVEASDGALAARAAVKVAVAPVNDAPVLAAQRATLDEDGRLELPLPAADVDGDPLTFTLRAPPRHGEATLAPTTGRLTYTPHRDFFGEDTLTVEVSDGRLKTAAPVHLEVRPVNDAPVVKPLALAAPEDTPARGQVVAADVDSALSFRVKHPPAHGQAQVDARGQVSWQPAPDWNGVDQFTLEVSDGALTADCLVSVVVAAVNDAPVVGLSPLEVDEDQVLTQALALSDVDGDALRGRLVRGPAHGTASLDADTGTLVWTPAHDFHGADAVTVEVTDGKLKTTAVLALVARPVNDAPVATPLTLSTREDVPVAGALAASDVDGDTLRYRIATPPRQGEASVEPATGQVRYLPAPDRNGADAFVVEVSDGALVATALVRVAVAPVDDPPLVFAATFETAEDTAAEGRLPATEADGEPLTFRLLSAPRLGAAVLLDAATGAFRFTPGADLNGDDALDFEVSDGKTSARGTLALRVSAVNDAPTLQPLALATEEDRPVEGQLRAADVDGDALSWRVLEGTQPGGQLTVEAGTGKVRFVPARDAHGEVRFQVVASDGRLSSEARTVTLSVAAVNDAPVARDSRLTLNEDELALGALAATDVDGDPMRFRVVTEPAHGTVTLVDAALGLYQYLPAPNYSGDDAFSFEVSDPSGASSSATVRLKVEEVNDAPVAMSDRISAPYRGVINGRLKGYDRESRRVSFRLVEKPSNGVLELVDPRTGEFTFTTEGRSDRECTARFVVEDGALTSEPAELVIHIRSM